MATMYTLGLWRPSPTREAEFVIAWQALGEVFRQLASPPVGTGLLLQSVSDPGLYCSFGPWESEADIQQMRGDPAAQAAIQRLRELCDEATPGAFRVVAEAPV